MKKGIITKMIGGFFFVADFSTEIHKTKIRGRIQKKIYPGDRVGIKNNMIEEVYPRDNLLHRPAIANVEQVILVFSLSHPTFSRELLDRFLVLIEAFNLNPIIVINKTDLMQNSNIEKPDLTDYQKVGYNIFFISAKTDKSIDPLYPVLKDKINVLTGPSGVGKSTLINSMIEKAEMPTRKVSQKLKKGVHTTRHVELISLKNGGWLADSPGFTSLNIDKIKKDKLKFLFPEFDDYHNGCKFNTCSHTHEPGCAVKKAVENGNISRKRYRIYNKFYQEL